MERVTVLKPFGAPQAPPERGAEGALNIGRRGRPKFFLLFYRRRRREFVSIIYTLYYAKVECNQHTQHIVCSDNIVSSLTVPN